MAEYNLTPVRDATDANDDNIGWLLYVQGEHHKPIAIIDDETMRKAVAKWLHLHPVYAKEMATKIHKEIRLERQNTT